MNIDNFKKIRKLSPFSKSYKTIQMDFRNEVSGNYAMYLKYYENYIPEFQRENNKWTKKMQISFVENLMLGCKSSLLFYTTSKREFPEWKILDGLQRITAINLFITNKIKIFKEFKYDDIKHILDDCNMLEFKLYRFDSEEEAIEFYISMNENITHSKKDIQKAKDFLAELTSA